MTDPVPCRLCSEPLGGWSKWSTTERDRSEAYKAELWAAALQWRKDGELPDDRYKFEASDELDGDAILVIDIESGCRWTAWDFGGVHFKTAE